MITALAIPALVHLLLGVWIARTIFRTPDWDRGGDEDEGRTEPNEIAQVVCLVAARNEEANLDACLAALLDQTPPVNVLVIDDHSEDGTRALTEKWRARFDGRLSVMAGGPGKALALSDAIDSTSEPVILTTDADCRPPPNWSSSMALMRSSGNLAALAGCTMVLPSTFLGKLEALDWAVLLATSSALSESGHPVTAMGNNMAIRRESLSAVGGFRAVATSLTEDYAVFRAMGENEAVELRMAADILNWTEPTNSLREAFRQRRRWALGGLDGTMTNRLIVIGSLLAFAAPLALLALAPNIGAPLILARWLVTALILAAAERRLQISLPKIWIPIHDALMTLYFILVPISLLFSRSTNWKNRKIESAQSVR